METLHVDANFPGGGVDRVRMDGSTLYFEAPLDGAAQSLWYCFRIRHAQGRSLTLVQTGLEHVLGVWESRGYQPVVPVFKDGEDGAWKRVDERSVVYTTEPLAFRFSISPKEAVCYVAFCYPYQWADWERFARTLKYAQCDTVGQTKAGRPFRRYLIRKPGASPEKLILLTARQHAGEVSGSYVLEGLLDRLLDGSPEMEALLDQAAFCVFPIMDLDCIEEGRYGKDQLPCDFNRDWRFRPYHPEIRHVYEELERLSERYTLWWSLDLHAPQPGAASYMPPSRAYAKGSPYFNRMWNFAIHYEDVCRSRVCYRLSDVDTEVLNWGGINNDGIPPFYHQTRWQSMSLCFEYAYHRDGEGRLLEKGDWHVMGEGLAETLAWALDAPGLEDAPDEGRIPAWAVGLPLNAWTSSRRVDHLRVEDGESFLTLTPLEATNSAWLLSPLYACSACDTFTLESDEDETLRLYASYYRDGLLLGHSHIDTLHLQKRTPCVFPVPKHEQDDIKIGVVVQDLRGAVRLRR